MRALIIRFEDHLLRLPLPAMEVSVGSGPSNGIVLPFPGVSRVHARLTPVAGGAILSDNGSKNRLIVNGERADRVELRPGVAVQIGRAQVMLDEVSTDDLAPTYPIAAVDLETHTPPETAGVDVDEGANRSREALALVRRIESLSDGARVRARADLLAAARALFLADSIVLFERQSGDLVLVATAGAPSRETLDAVSVAIAHGRGDVRKVFRTESQTAIALNAHRKKASVSGIAASFPRRHVAEWESDLLDYLSLRLLSQQKGQPTSVPLADELVFPKGMVAGSSPAMTGLLASIRATVRSSLDVLLLGETGTGKEVFARVIHASGPTAGGPFVAINCAAIPTELLEAELFGVQGRVATGVDPRQGHFLQANGGSIFLDEIGELSEALQAKLLRVLQEREVLPLGAATPRKIQVRVIAASNRDLAEHMREGKFRADLYYRLRGLQFHIPPLRERKEDLPPLVLAFVEQFAAEYGKRLRGVSRSAMELLLEHDWPGNVRELRSEIARAVLLAFDGGILQTEHFAPVQFLVDQRGAVAETGTTTQVQPPPPPPTHAPPSLQERVEALEREAILEALHRAAGNKSLAAKLLGITRNGLALKMTRLRLK